MLQEEMGKQKRRSVEARQNERETDVPAKSTGATDSAQET